MSSRNYRAHIDNCRERVKTSDEMGDEDAEKLLEFSDRMDLLRSREVNARGKEVHLFAISEGLRKPDLDVEYS